MNALARDKKVEFLSTVIHQPSLGLHIRHLHHLFIKRRTLVSQHYFLSRFLTDDLRLSLSDVTTVPPNNDDDDVHVFFFHLKMWSGGHRWNSGKDRNTKKVLQVREIQPKQKIRRKSFFLPFFRSVEVSRFFKSGDSNWQTDKWKNNQTLFLPFVFKRPPFCHRIDWTMTKIDGNFKNLSPSITI